MNFIRKCVVNPVAANMLMVVILVGGWLAARSVPRELFPEFSVDLITVTVPYPGASPSDIEEGICLKIEDNLTGLDGVEEISSESREGIGVVSLKLHADADARKVLDEVKSEVDKIDFPLEAEDPTTVEVTLRRHVIHVAVAGEAPEHTLKELAEEIRDEINDLPEVSQVSVSGVRDYEISVEIPEQTLRRHNLTLSEVARSIRESSFDLPAGTIKTQGGEMSIRVVGQRYTAEEFKAIPILTLADGTVVRLGELATVLEGFEDVDIGGQYNGQPAALVSVFKTADEDTIRITDAVKAYVERARGNMPEGITLETWSDMSKVITDRMDMLVRNGLQGLIFVVAVLWLFLGIRLSFWVALGIPVSLLGAIAVMKISGDTLNMMSMFALIMALGLIVDDAIVVGESVYSRIERGEPPLDAAVQGTRLVMLPVVGAVATTWVAFVPMLFIPGMMGKFVGILPKVVILALGFSLLECLVILPPHLGHGLKRRRERGSASDGGRGWARKVRARIDGAIRRFIDERFIPFYRLAARFRYVTVAVALGVLITIGGAIAGGRMRVIVFPRMESDTVRALLILPTGTPISETAAARQISLGARKLNDQFQAKDGGPVVMKVYSLLGQRSRGGGGGAHIADIVVEFRASEDRDIRSLALVQRWRENTGPIPAALSLTFGGFHGGPGGKQLEVRLLGQPTSALEAAAEMLKTRLAGYPGVTDIEDDALPGKMEMKVRLKPGAEALGINLRTLGSQLRDAFYGNESLKLQRGRDEIKVMVRYPASERRSLGNVEQMRVRTPDGAEVPFNEVADVRMERGYTTLRRVGGKSVVTVSADVDEKAANAEQILKDLEEGGTFQELTSLFPGTKIDQRGQRQQMSESLDALKVWFPIALLCIYTILAVIFKSYIQPLIIMMAIPFGLVGAVIGHWILGYDLTLLSMFGMVALTGIVVNDALVLLDLVNRKIRSGGEVFESVAEAVRERFRPIILTTITTIAGMTPLLAERSFQAQFLKPMVVSIAFGLGFATLLTLVVVPSLQLIGNDLRRGIRWALTGKWVSPEEVVTRPAVEAEADQDL